MIAVIYGGDGWPNLSIAELGSLGYTHIVYPLALILPVCLAVGDSLRQLRQEVLEQGTPRPVADETRARAYLSQAVELEKWVALEQRDGAD